MDALRQTTDLTLSYAVSGHPTFIVANTGSGFTAVLEGSAGAGHSVQHLLPSDLDNPAPGTYVVMALGSHSNSQRVASRLGLNAEDLDTLRMGECRTSTVKECTANI